MTDSERLGFEQEVADLRFALRQALDQRDLLSVKVSQWEATPTLTDEEREAVAWAIDALVGIEDFSPSAVSADARAAAKLRKLLERLK